MSRLNFGVSIWLGDCWIIDKLSKLYDLGLTFVEVSLDYPLPYRDESRFLTRLEEEKRKLGLKIGFHMPWRDISLASPLEPIRRGAVEVYKRCIDETLKFEPSYYNLHLSTLENINFDNVWSEVLESSYKSLVEILEHLDEASMLTVENNDSRVFHMPDHFEYLSSVLRDVMFCLDVGHALIASIKNSRSKINPFEIILKWSKALPRGRLKLLHVHGVSYSKNSKTILDHTLLSTSILSVEEVSEALKPHNVEYVNLEVFRNAEGKEKIGYEDIEGQFKILISRFKR